MNKIRVTKILPLEMAHALLDYDGDCKNIHGHSYKLHLTFIGEVNQSPGHPKDGMVIDFKDLKAFIKGKVIDVFDHALVLNIKTPQTLKQQLSNNFKKLIFTKFQPTCEQLLLHFVQLINSAIPSDIELIVARLYETDSSYSEWQLGDQLSQS